ncbi:MAG: DegT/DnrJ/EryC1/StrS family aminotransferase [Candidatus Zixiibacteriota bacterium]
MGQIIVQKKIPICKTFFDQSDFDHIIKPLQSGWVVQGQYVAEFEQEFSRFTDAKFSTAVSSCSTGLHLALAALGIGFGDEVIVPAFTWVATANAAEHLGAKAVFCDIELSSYNIDPKKIESKITDKTRAIIAVHLFGLPAPMDEIKNLCDKYSLYLVEDAACGMGAHYNGQHVGHWGEIACYSFHPRKAITTGEGGMLTTNNAKLAKKMKSLRNHGASLSDYARHNAKEAFLLSEYKLLGYNYRMTDIQGALGLAQMQKADWIIKQRQEKAKIYDQLLKNVKAIRTPITPQSSVHGFQSYVCLFEPKEITLGNLPQLNKERNQLMVWLEGEGISTRQGTHAVSLLEYYQKKYGLSDEDFPNAYIADKLTIALPLYPQITEEEQEYVVDKLKGGLEISHD